MVREEALGHVREFYGDCGWFPSLPQLGELSDYEPSDRLPMVRAEALGHVREFYGDCARFPSLPQLGELSDYELSDRLPMSERKRWGTFER